MVISWFVSLRNSLTRFEALLELRTMALFFYADLCHDVRPITKIAYLISAGAALIQLLCIIFILPTYWGWWHFGRKISFSPLEMAKAFDSPLLVRQPKTCVVFLLDRHFQLMDFSPLTFFHPELQADCDSNSSGSQVAKVMDDKRVRYTALVDDAGNRTTRNGIGKFCFTNSDSGETSASKQLRA